MNTQAKGASAPILKTAVTKFFPCNPAQDALFSVNPSVPVEDALGTASCFLASAVGIMQEVALQIDTNEAWAALYLVEMSKGVVDAANKTIQFGGA